MLRTIRSIGAQVEVKGAQLFLGKGHFAAADGLVSGGALEGNIDAQASGLACRALC